MTLKKIIKIIILVIIIVLSFTKTFQRGFPSFPLHLIWFTLIGYLFLFGKFTSGFYIRTFDDFLKIVAIILGILCILV